MKDENKNDWMKMGAIKNDWNLEKHREIMVLHNLTPCHLFHLPCVLQKYWEKKKIKIRQRERERKREREREKEWVQKMKQFEEEREKISG